MEEKDSNDKKLEENNLSNEPKNEENVEEISNTHSITLIQLIIILIVIALVISVIYIYTNDDRNYVLDKVGIPSNGGAVTEVNETKVDSNDKYDETTMTLESYGMDQNLLIVSYRCKLSEKVDYFVETLIESPQIVDGDKVYYLEEVTESTFSKVNDYEYEVFKTYEIDANSLSNNAMFKTNLKLYKEFEGPYQDLIAEWDFEIKLDKSKIGTEFKKYTLENKVATFEAVETTSGLSTRTEDLNLDFMPTVELLEVSKSNLATKLVLMLDMYFTNVNYFVEVIGENGDIILEDNIQTAFGGYPKSVIIKPTDDKKITIKVYQKEWLSPDVYETTAVGTLEVDFTKDLIEKDETIEVNNETYKWEDLELTYNKEIMKVDYDEEHDNRPAMMFEIFGKVGTKIVTKEYIHLEKFENIFDADIDTLLKELEYLEQAGPYALKTTNTILIEDDDHYVVEEIEVTHKELVTLMENGSVELKNRTLTKEELTLNDVTYTNIEKTKVAGKDARVFVKDSDYNEVNKCYMFLHNGYVYTIETSASAEYSEILETLINQIKITK